MKKRGDCPRVLFGCLRQRRRRERKVAKAQRCKGKILERLADRIRWIGYDSAPQKRFLLRSFFTAMRDQAMNRKVRWGTGFARVGFVCAIGAQALSVSVSSLSAQAQDAPATQSTDNPKSKTMNQDNPFFSASKLPFQAPDFASIKPEHFASAFEAGMAQQLEQVRSIALQQDPPSFENTLVSMEKSGEILTRVAVVFFNLAGAHTNDAIQEIEREVAPKLASHSDDIYLNKQLFGRVERLWNQRGELKLSEEQQRLLKKTYEDFVRAGAKLSEPQQVEVRAINERISTLTT